MKKLLEQLAGKTILNVVLGPDFDTLIVTCTDHTIVIIGIDTEGYKWPILEVFETT